MKLLTVIGTRPEAIKTAPVLLALRAEPGVDARLCVTGQHGALCDQALAAFGLTPDVALPPPPPGRSLGRLLGQTVMRLDALIAAERPDRLIIQGDTTTALAGALAAAQRGIPVAHVEAGLRTYRNAEPHPEEINRRAIDVIADWLFAPTEQAAAQLASERLEGRILVTGNSGVDALLWVRDRLARDPALGAAAAAGLPPGPLLLVTMHRREGQSRRLPALIAALRMLAAEGVPIALPVHPSPSVRGAVEAALSGVSGIHLLPPLPFPAFTALMMRARLILTDSGGVQEEAPSLGRPVLVLRGATERTEGIAAGGARLVDEETPEAIAAAVRAAWADPPPLPPFNPYGDGHAAARIAAAVCGRAAEPFAPPLVADPLPDDVVH
jgi:UDP-N-acetylglucosamine 2-epimerase (non-hydrolysing)